MDSNRQIQPIPNDYPDRYIQRVFWEMKGQGFSLGTDVLFTFKDQEDHPNGESDLMKWVQEAASQITNVKQLKQDLQDFLKRRKTLDQISNQEYCAKTLLVVDPEKKDGSHVLPRSLRNMKQKNIQAVSAAIRRVLDLNSLSEWLSYDLVVASLDPDSRKRSTKNKAEWTFLMEERKRRSQKVIYGIMSGNNSPDGCWEKQIGGIFATRTRNLGPRQRRNLLVKCLEWMNDYFARYEQPPHVPPIPPPEKYKAFLDSKLFSRKGPSRKK